MYIIALICEINLDLFRQKRIRASEYQVSQTFTYPLLKHMASVYTPQLSDSIDKPCLSCKTILIAKLPLQHIFETTKGYFKVPNIYYKLSRTNWNAPCLCVQ